MPAVLRSREDRFGAVVLSLGFDTMRVWVARARRAVDQIEGVLREHFAYCPDNIDYPIDADTYRARLAQGSYWSFWWD